MITSKRIAIWSGPRSLSTALMRAWESRADTIVWDEPLYPAWLRETGTDHDGADRIIDAYESDWRKVVEKATLDPIPDGAGVLFLKFISRNHLESMGTDWLRHLRNGFLIREPYDQILSLHAGTFDVTLEDTGLPQLRRLFHSVVRHTGQPPPLLDARDLQNNPGPMLQQLCDAMDVPFDPVMTTWRPGERQTDGIWSKNWYGTVIDSQGFMPYRPKETPMPQALQPLLQASQEIYCELYAHRLVPPPSDDQGSFSAPC